MHVGLIIYGRLETLTGGYIYDKFLVDHLRQQGHPVDIISLPWRNYGRHLADNLSRELYHDLRRARYDILLEDELNHPSLFWLNRKLTQKIKYPIVTIVHQILSRQPRTFFANLIFGMIERHYLSSVNAFIFNSQTTRTTVGYLTGTQRPSIVAAPAGDRLGFLPSKALIRSRAHQSGPLQLLHIGNVRPNKGLHPLITRLADIAPEKWHLTVVGSLAMDRRYVQEVQRLIARKNLWRQITLTGALDGPELAGHLARSHIFTMPFSHESFGMAYLEGMAYGLPAIGSSAGAVKEFIQPGVNGFLVEPQGPAALSEHLESLYNDRQRLYAMGAAAWETFHARPRWRQTMQKIQIFLQDLVHHEGGSDLDSD
ncbi:MAG: glycosyltransferase family 4 protein [Desulfobacterales bacterium]|nr:MAG: glycosyltransferase family 4 protein [Desulfobacterales bacterium]